MKEFDFDELDKAVSSLMGDVKQQDNTPPSTPSASPSSPPISESTSTTTSLPVPSSPDPVEPPAPPTSHASTVAESAPSSLAESSPVDNMPASIPRRSSGRFMDVVHPSSDMRSAPSLATPSREGTALQPLTPVQSTPPARPPQPVIDVMAPVAAPEAVPSVEDEPSSSSGEAEEIKTNSAPSEPWSSSPFLRDTQVEKRPLGGSPSLVNATGLSEAIAAELSQDTETVVPPASNLDTTTPQPVEPTPDVSSDELPSQPPADLQLNPKPEPVAMPAELDTNLVAIESGHTETPSSPSTFLTPPESTAASAVLSTSSISQQYDERPSSGDNTHTPIYDNEAVHQPLAHPVKKKSGWLLVIFIVGIIVIGGGLGALAYFLGLI